MALINLDQSEFATNALSKTESGSRGFDSKYTTVGRSFLAGRI